MTPRQQRMVLVLFILAGAALTVGLTVAAFRQNLLFFYTPSQIVADEADTAGRTFRLGGLVAEDSLQKSADSIEVRFAVTDTAQAVTVSYSGVLPDLFREGQGVVVRGSWQDGIMIADEVLAKHDENYMPPEAQAAIEAAKTLEQ
ncbi:MAG: cytochrome c maturation protein CcmE [Betaproteobacteria bacterium]|nr:cytochrome c maturation protein CcmE [Betaproteobacteria bacterium]